MDTEYFTPDQVAEMLRVHLMTVYRMIKDGRLGAHKIGTRTLRITRKDIDDFISRSSTGKSKVSR